MFCECTLVESWKVKGEIHSKTKICYVVENGVKPQDLKYFTSYVFMLIFQVVSRKNRPHA